MRSIPAHAGKPLFVPPRPPRAMVYPRPRGEAATAGYIVTLIVGLSPPTRGSLHLRGQRGMKLGSIPAHAGKPAPPLAALSASAVYPRPRGEAATYRERDPLTGGLSPPTRGSPRGCRASLAALRSIPAHAGKPPPRSEPGWRSTVYPRPRGEAAAEIGSRVEVHGLSPPTRGSRQASAGDNRWSRSIPAHAGKPSTAPAPGSAGRVYPRPRGEAARSHGGGHPMSGLSPPTRGSRRADPALVGQQRSIPAHAGKPRTWRARITRAWVYPRPRGEAADQGMTRLPYGGLSPPTRGSHLRARCCDRHARSIPAHAGKPASRREWTISRRVYPRPRGEAWGLYDAMKEILGSIPAHAGKPDEVRDILEGSGVYPRPRGEARPVRS